jgi:hypothetical protein
VPGGPHPVGEGGVDLGQHPKRPRGATADSAGDEREDGLLRVLGGEHKGEQEAPGVLAPVPLVLGIKTNGKGERPEVVLGHRRGAHNVPALTCGAGGHVSQW